MISVEKYQTHRIRIFITEDKHKKEENIDSVRR